MTERPDLSRLPADPAYWDELEARVMAELGPRVRARPAANALAPLARGAWRLTGLAAAAILAALLLTPSRARPEPSSALPIARTRAPASAQVIVRQRPWSR